MSGQGAGRRNTAAFPGHCRGRPGDFERRLSEILDAVNASTVLRGFCYTQLTDGVERADVGRGKNQHHPAN
jgi:hypothetical protein